MWRAVKILAFVAALSWATVWLADNPGTVQLNWLGHQVETSIALLLASVATLCFATALLYRVWIMIRKAPANIGKFSRDRRQKKGYEALTRGMVAVAAGDRDEAQKLSRRAENLLDQPPLTMLLSAQAAQLGGDEKAASQFFKSMLEDKETEFLGLRGLINQAIKDGNQEEALELARRAYQIKPKSEWVVQSLFDLQTQGGHWTAAQSTLQQSLRIGAMPSEDIAQHKAVLELQMSLEAEEKGDKAQALRHARKANDLDRNFIPAALQTARLFLEVCKNRKAASVIDKTWENTPHPDFVPLYYKARNAIDPMARYTAAERLAKQKPGHIETRLMVARAAIDAKFWGKARDYLSPVILDCEDSNKPVSARLCKLMAELEEAEHGNMEEAHVWLRRASVAEPDPLWVCSDCGNAVPDWSALCGNCWSFDTFHWGSPPHVAQLAPMTSVIAGPTRPEAQDNLPETIEGDVTEKTTDVIAVDEADAPAKVS